MAGFGAAGIRNKLQVIGMGDKPPKDYRPIGGAIPSSQGCQLGVAATGYTAIGMESLCQGRAPGSDGFRE